MGNPLVILACKGINKDNKTNVTSLAAAIRSIILTGGSYSIKKPGADQLTAICALLDDLQLPPTPPNDDSPVTKKQLDEALQQLTDTIHSTPGQHANPTSYAGAAQRGAENTDTTRKAPSPEIQEKQITISIRKLDQNVKVTSLTLSELTALCNSTLTKFFTQPENGAIIMEAPICSTSRLKSSNITLTFQNKEDAARAKIHEEWAKIIDPQATLLQCMYTVVVHNAPIDIHKEDTPMQESITDIKDQNSEVVLP
jgi:hypothetical protein